jgi:predicted DNA-binding protein YlxM (UPF0122 family)
MTAQTITAPRPKRATRQKKPRKGSKTENILTLATTTPATQAEIAQAVNVSTAAVCQTLKRYGIDYNQLENFRKRRADIFAGLQDKILNTVSVKDIKDASVLQRVTAAGILYDKERLETGKTTANIGTLIARIQDIQREESDG